MKVYIFILISVQWAKSDIFTSSLKLCYLLSSEIQYIEKMEELLKNIKNGENSLTLLSNIKKQIPDSLLKRKIRSTDECLDENSEISLFITNPVNAYTVVKRFSKEWSLMTTNLRILNESSLNPFINHVNPVGPNELKGGQEAFYRISQFYDLKPEYLVSGLLHPAWEDYVQQWSPIPLPLSANDAFEIGKIAFNYQDYKQAVSWLKESQKMIKEDLKNENKDLLFEVLDYLSWSQHEIGEDQEAFENCLIMNNIHPENERISSNLMLFNKTRIFGSSKNAPSMIDYVLNSINDSELSPKIKQGLRDFKLNGQQYAVFERSLSHLLCRYGVIWPPAGENNIDTRCFVRRGNNQFGKFMTANIEKIYSDPDVFLFRNMVNDKEILHLKTIAKNRLRTATVHNSATGKLETVDYRITQSSWFDMNYDDVVRKLKVKLQVASGLTLKSSEDLQIANYGLGGYYDTHFDFATMNEPAYRDDLTRTNGGRLATFLLYMSNVAIGGRTGFQRLGISVETSKGDALFWHNLHPDETGDARTRHIACPVVLGTKWVANFWIRAKGEENTRPCKTVPQNGI